MILDNSAIVLMYRLWMSNILLDDVSGGHELCIRLCPQAPIEMGKRPGVGLLAASMVAVPFVLVVGRGTWKSRKCAVSLKVMYVAVEEQNYGVRR